jgi:alkylhydroperoxidase family enzyme
MPQVKTSTDGEAATTTLMAYAPEIAAAAISYSDQVYRRSKLNWREMEAARYRTALINGCNVCRQFRAARDLTGYLGDPALDEKPGAIDRGPAPDEEFYMAIPTWRQSPLFEPRERLVLELAERIGEQPRSMDSNEDFWKRMHEHFSDAEIVEITLSIGSWIGLGRVVHALELDGVCAVSS